MNAIHLVLMLRKSFDNLSRICIPNEQIMIVRYRRNKLKTALCVRILFSTRKHLRFAPNSRVYAPSMAIECEQWIKLHLCLDVDGFRLFERRIIRNIACYHISGLLGHFRHVFNTHLVQNRFLTLSHLISDPPLCCFRPELIHILEWRYVPDANGFVLRRRHQTYTLRICCD